MERGYASPELFHTKLLHIQALEPKAVIKIHLIHSLPLTQLSECHVCVR